ncbi:MAG TPA: DNA mismatch repair protein MutS, partial [Gemmatimonas sp.]|uniref:DNA mismatch repair protein MutS n=1 Tax=Gemmatimonas sp. TaxID=1962908 RepID=UPI002ED9E90D
GIAAADLSTGELRLFGATIADTPAVLARLAPRELLLVKNTAHAELAPVLRQAEQALVTSREGWEFDAQLAADDLSRQFEIRSLEGFGLGADDAAAVGAAGALLRYLRELQPGGLPHLARPTLERSGGVMPLDEMTRRNLELVESLRGDQRDNSGTLLSVLDRTTTPMGQRMLRQWLLAPLLEQPVIEQRLDAVSALVRDPVGRTALRDALDGVRDVERLASKAAAGRATPRELRALGDSLARLPLVAKSVHAVLSSGAQATGGVLSTMLADWDDGAESAERLTTMLVARPPLTIGEEDTIAPGVDVDLDELRVLRDGGKDAIATIQQQERARTGISSLKVGYNKVFGYFLEISNANRHLVPDDYQRRQTLTGAERYVTPALKEYEEKVLNAAERIEVRERELFEALRRDVGVQITRWQQVARRVATIDVLACFADVAEREQYVRPELHDGFALDIRAGRHPVVERMMAREKFIPNDLQFTDDAQLIVLTGPNMAGKSTILRQIGLIQLMAQVGMYVPAREARLPIVDRLFTRVGASDNLVRGQSTFMVEMSETSAILHTATKRSLVLLDEIGRGTSTYDGVSIAWSVSEHLHDAIGCKTVFATHYHELTQLESELSGVRNFTVAVREVGDQVLFLHRLIPGGADRSYGIEVGRLAGLPSPVIARAKEVLALLEGEGEQMAARLTAEGMQAPQSTKRRGPRLKHQLQPTDQLGFFGDAPPAVDPALSRLADAVDALEPEQMTPMQALNTLASLKESLRQQQPAS